MLAGGCAIHVESVHGERITVLTGASAGQVFVGVREVEQDEILDGMLGIDPRAKRVIRFRRPLVPNLESQDTIQTDDNRIWKAVRRPDSSYLTTDFELIEVVNGNDA